MDFNLSDFASTKSLLLDLLPTNQIILYPVGWLKGFEAIKIIIIIPKSKEEDTTIID